MKYLTHDEPIMRQAMKMPKTCSAHRVCSSSACIHKHLCMCVCMHAYVCMFMCDHEASHEDAEDLLGASCV
jgi:hypothetical protein